VAFIGRIFRTGQGIALVLAAACLLASASSARGAVGDLTYEQCWGEHNGCISAAGDKLSFVPGLALSPDGTSLYASGLESLVHFTIGPSGGLTVADCLAEVAEGDLCSTATTNGKPLKETFAVAVDPNRAALFESAMESEDVAQFFLQSGKPVYGGCVSSQGSEGHCSSAGIAGVLDGITDLAVSPDGNQLYAAAKGNSPATAGLMTFAVAPEGQITFRSCVTSGGTGGLCGKPSTGEKLLEEISDVVVSPNGQSLYSVSALGVINRFKLGAEGQVTWLGCVSQDGSGGACTKNPAGDLLNATDIAISPDGGQVYVVSARGDVLDFSVEADGTLESVGCVASKPKPGCTVPPGVDSSLLEDATSLAVSPDGKSLYVGAAKAISAFALDAEGKPSFQSCVSAEQLTGCGGVGNAVEGLAAVSVSPDGSSVYAGSEKGAVVHFLRSLTNAPPGGGPGGGGGGGNQTGGVTAAEIKAGLLAQLTPKGKGAKLASLARRKGYSLAFKALSAGGLTIDWYLVPHGAHVSAKGKPKPKPVLVAAGTLAFKAPGTKTIFVKLTHRGKAMLAGRHQLKLTAKGSFKPSGAASAVSAIKKFTLRR
jgi:DNA-binding beta-propeller fold protein YncE